MDISFFIRRNLFASSLLALHTALIGAYAWIELDHAWNDMNPTMLVMAATHLFDYPIHLVLHPLIDIGRHTGTYLVALLVLGGAFWFAVGWTISRVCRTVWQLTVGNRPIPHGA